MTRHRCAWVGGYQDAVTKCKELPNGAMWVTNEEHSSQVNYCPFCGVPARVRVELKADPDADDYGFPADEDSDA